MFTLTSKRALKQLIDEGHVHGWDDPRMPTIAALRRRGYTPGSIRDFCGRVGITKKENTIELGALENCLREDLNENAQRRVAVLDPIKVIIENFPAGETETLSAANHPNRPELGAREVTFSRELWIERDDFMEDPPRKFFRLKPGGEVRLRYGYIIKCEEVVKDAAGEIDYLRCTMDAATRSGSGPESERKVKGTIHWLSAATAQPAVVHLYDRLFKVPSPSTDLDLSEQLNPDSLVVRDGAYVEPVLIDLAPATPVQFERLGYFVLDADPGDDGRPRFNRAVTLRDSWAKLERQLLAQA